MVLVENVKKDDLDELISLAKSAWQHTYQSIISQAQIDFMLKTFYEKSRLEKEMDDELNIFSKAVFENKIVGYTHCILQNNQLKLSKIYMLPTEKQKGIGSLLIENVKDIAKKCGVEKIILQVNRNNSAKEFYLKKGFIIITEVDDILDNYILNDYVMELDLNT
ncbi:MAG: GNAT family N-acetyltransferase [Chitinophagaceae bacterium]|nr:GNAT family N-acetyltransferase [Chitinophagaceae bacterium]